MKSLDKVVDFFRNYYVVFSRDEIKSLFNLIADHRGRYPLVAQKKFGIFFEFGQDEDVSFLTIYAADKSDYKKPLLDVKITGMPLPVDEKLINTSPPPAPTNWFDTIFFSESLFTEHLKSDSFNGVHFFGSLTTIYGRVGGFESFFNLVAVFEYKENPSSSAPVGVLPFEVGLPCPPDWPPVAVEVD